ncbi:MAG: preprotein translocase subunit SecA [Planctomycetota bacterium]
MIEISDISQRAGGILNRTLKFFFGSRNERVLDDLAPTVAAINALEPATQALSDEAMRAKTTGFRERLAKGAALDDILVEAFAVAREAGRRHLRMRHFDVQLVGGMILHQGKIAEMVTGEGKTLVATLPAYLNALTGKGVHIITVNDYLARRDRDWMGPLFESLGLTVGVIQSDMDSDQRKVAYGADITYGTNNEFGFDYLRDNMKVHPEAQSQRGHHFAIVDEVDSILIDEARTPLIISGASEESTRKYYDADRVARRLVPGKDFIIKEKDHTCALTEEGLVKAEKFLGVEDFYTGPNMEWPHHIDQALRAHNLYKRDKDYIAKDGEVIIVDEFTGRLMPGRRWSDGLHQAIEAKENLRIKEENLTLATITIQNYFKLYAKLAGMTGTAMTEADEFFKIYKLDVTAIPPNKPMRRVSFPDVVYRSEREKYNAILEEIVDLNVSGRPVLVGTISIEKSERISEMLKNPVHAARMLDRRIERLREMFDAKKTKIAPALADRALELLRDSMKTDAAAVEALAKETIEAHPKDEAGYLLQEIARAARTLAAVRKGVRHEVLNAKYHEREAVIVAQAGRLGALTIATNMAGRGTDILLGGNPDALTAEKLHQESLVPGAPEYEARRREIFPQMKALTDAEHDRVVALDGLHILGTERHEARRIDNQLRGRSGRQGDPGSSRFFLSLEDDLMRIFASDWVKNLLERLGMTEGQQIESGMVTRGIERAQKRVEEHHFGTRKSLLEYDEVMNEQRKIIYAQRQDILEGRNLKDYIQQMIDEEIAGAMETHCPPKTRPDEWDLEDLADWATRKFETAVRREEFAGKGIDAVRAKLAAKADQSYAEREAAFTPERMRELERYVLLQVIDTKWRDHLTAMEQLRAGIGFRGYAGTDPKLAYKKEGYELFQAMIDAITDDATELLFKMKMRVESGEELRLREKTGVTSRPAEPTGERFGPAHAPRDEAPAGPPPADGKPSLLRAAARAGRNDPCPCGSGKKFKKCCGKNA